MHADRVVAAAAAAVMVAVLAPPAPAAPAFPPQGAEAALGALVEAAGTGDVGRIRAAALRYAEAIRAASRELREGPRAQRGTAPPGLLVAAQRVREATERHLFVLRQVLARVPEQARPAIEHAIAAASRGHEEALAALGRAQGRPGGQKGKP